MQDWVNSDVGKLSDSTFGGFWSRALDVSNRTSLRALEVVVAAPIEAGNEGKDPGVDTDLL